MHKAARVLIIIGSGWSLLIVVWAYFALSHPRLSTKWKQEPLPPEPVSELRLGDAGEILARTQGGDLYEYVYEPQSPWIKVSNPSGVPSLGMDCYPDEAKNTFGPPGKVKSQLSEACVYNESVRYLTFVLLENGEVWSWQHEVYAYTQMALIPVLCLSCIPGGLILLLGLGLMAYQKRKRTSEEEKA
jgi:hypothetical protein